LIGCDDGDLQCANGVPYDFHSAVTLDDIIDAAPAFFRQGILPVGYLFEDLLRLQFGCLVSIHCCSSTAVAGGAKRYHGGD
jgi:hypothetical protein